MSTLYLVTGAAGYLGGEVCRQIVSRGKKARALVLPKGCPGPPFLHGLYRTGRGRTACTFLYKRRDRGECMTGTQISEEHVSNLMDHMFKQKIYNANQSAASRDNKSSRKSLYKTKSKTDGLQCPFSSEMIVSEDSFTKSASCRWVSCFFIRYSLTLFDSSAGTSFWPAADQIIFLKSLSIFSYRQGSSIHNKLYL